MPSPAVNAKNALVYCFTLLSSRLAERGGAPSALPDMGEWIYVRARARFALNPIPPMHPGEAVTWKDLARLEKAYRPHLKFQPLFEPFLKAVEAGVCPYAKLLSTHWDEMSRHRSRIWGERSIRARVIDWLIYELRDFEEFLFWETFPSYQEFCSKNVLKGLLVGTHEMWKVAGQLLAAQLGRSFKVPVGAGSDVLAAEAGYAVFIDFQKQFHRWCLKQPEVKPGIKRPFIRATEMVLRRLGYEPFEARLVRIRLIDFGKSSYRDPWIEDGNQLKRLQVPTLLGIELARKKEADTERKRKIRGSTKRRSLVEEQEIKRAEEAARLAQLSRDTAV